MKRPSFQFYPGDWQRDAALRMCSVGARGLWIEMLCLMHQGSPYGYLKVNDKVIHVDNLARIVGATTQEVQGWLQELEGAGVYSREEDGTIVSRRMIRDEEIRKKRSDGGHLGGNPALKKTTKKVGLKVNHQANLQPTPSSSSSSSSSKEKQGASAFVLADWVPVEAWEAYLEMRKKNRKSPTVRAMELVVLELDKLRAKGHEPGAVLLQSVQNSWTDVYAVKDKGIGAGGTAGAPGWWTTDNSIMAEAVKEKISTQGKTTQHLINEIRAAKARNAVTA